MFVFIKTGDVDSGDDNESERYSNQSSNRTTNNSQRRLPPHTNVRTNFHNHPQQLPMTGSVSAATSPLSHQQQHQSYNGMRQNSSSAMPSYINAISKPVNNLDLINGVVDIVTAAALAAGSASPVNNSSTAGSLANCSASNNTNLINRQMRLRVYGNGKGVRHETKL